MTLIAASVSGREALFLVMAAGVTISFLAAGARAMRGRAKAARSVIAGAVKPYGGRIIEAGWFEPDRAEFELEGVSCRMTWQAESADMPQQTTIMMDLPSRDALRVRTEGEWLPIRKLFGAEDVEVGDGPFDAAFQVEGSPAFAKRKLTEAVRGELMRWKEAEASLEMGAGGTFFRVNRDASHDGMQIALLLQSAGRLVRALQGGSPAVTILESCPGTCPTCRGRLEGTLVRCSKCGAKQHADCWAYVGGCAIYACGSTRST